MLVVTDLFKGATRPACLWGIPYKPAIFTFLFFMLLAAWTWMPLILLSAPALYAMRLLTKRRSDFQAARGLAQNRSESQRKPGFLVRLGRHLNQRS